MAGPICRVSSALIHAGRASAQNVITAPRKGFDAISQSHSRSADTPSPIPDASTIDAELVSAGISNVIGETSSAAAKADQVIDVDPARALLDLIDGTVGQRSTCVAEPTWQGLEA